MSQLDNYWQIIEFEEIDSTNLYLKNRLLNDSVDEFTVVTANFQTKGRGQMGNTWNANRGDNLLFSILIYPHMVLANKQFVISQIIALAVSNVLSSIVDNIKVKWPNDIYWNNKKIAGILIENNLRGTSVDSSVIGVGININQKMFAEDLINPVSLSIITGKKHEKEEILDKILIEFGCLYNELKTNNGINIKSKYLANLYRAQGYHWYKDAKGNFEAKIKDVQPTGHLVLSVQGDVEDRVYAFKEVQFINL